jgi:hypothetical protein
MELDDGYGDVDGQSEDQGDDQALNLEKKKEKNRMGSRQMYNR